MKVSNKLLIILLFTALVVVTVNAKTITLSKEVLQDKIKGGWAGQVIGCSFGGPTEFKYRSTFIQDYQPLEWNENVMKYFYENVPGLYDDVYMDLTFVDVFDKKGIDAPADEFAKAFANAEYLLWHANIAARYNILRGIMPPKSGHWHYNPHAEDIDFQIEADFAGLMSPGMINTSAEICDKIGHIMNYGDGWYGGVYVAAMYALAFTSNDLNYIINEALKVIPKESKYYQCMSDVIKWHKQYPDDWKMTWFKTQQKWGQDIGCPDGVFTTFNIDANINSAWILLGLLYGDGDYTKTLSISTRGGDDSDCNPASAGGILGTMLGYSNIPAFWKQGIDKVEDMDFKYTTMSLNDTYTMSFNQALEVIKKNGGQVGDKDVTITFQEPKAVKLEVGFEGHYPAKRAQLGKKFNDEATFEFEGIGFATTGSVRKTGDDDYIFDVEMYIDGKLVETSKMPSKYIIRKDPLFWQYQLSNAKHTVKIKILNPSDKAQIEIGDIITYTDKPLTPKY
ncbi:MAG TPA: ADP-ribosylglycohydrolase family protein [bacterium]|nr:ADP-ribosylglycohydrolase family protein [bacterium]HPN43083.1 ADP-ribosylglycohydrolase family protein [bacterium]